jgi:glyoxylase-like metal-dependent hydrolase (beta-lactamase superfamily II)
MMPDHNQTGAPVQTLDLNFRGAAGTIAVYLIPHPHGAALVECGPGSALPELLSGISALGLQPSQITDVLLTHIHLDHGGSAGWWATQGARVHVHPAGASHLVNPEKLLTSAGRIYGASMQTLWGDFLPVPVDRLVIHQDNETFEVEGLRFRALAVPGHASHHFAYICQGVCFTGDIGGIRVGGTRHIRLPMPPPELDLALWQQSARRLQAEQQKGAFSRIAPTHFGIFDDPNWHLQTLRRSLVEVEAWMNQVMPAGPSVEELNRLFLEWTAEQSQASGLLPGSLHQFEIANPSWMSAQGLYRYWHKVLHPD